MSDTTDTPDTQTTLIKFEQPQGAAPLAMLGQSALPMRVEEITAHKELVHAVMKAVMIEEVHYGKVGTSDKRALLQPGAQILCVTFRLVAKPASKTMRDLGNGHREWVVDTILTTPDGIAMGYGCGSCSTMEEKYRWRNDGADGESTGHNVPGAYWQIKDRTKRLMTLRQICNEPNANLGVAKVDSEGRTVPKGRPGGEWKIVRYPEHRVKVENENIADTYNTVLKIACKRSLVHAVLNTTGASDIFTQDIDDDTDPEGPQADGGGTTEPREPSPEDKRTARTNTKPTPRPDGGGAPANTPANQPPAPVEYPAGSWQAVEVEATDGNIYKLGQLALHNLESLWTNRIVPLGDLEKQSAATKKLAAAVAMGIAEKKAAKGAPTDPPADGAQTPPAPAGETHPLVTKQADDKRILEEAKAKEAAEPDRTPKPGTPAGEAPAQIVYEFDADAIKRLRELCAENIITEETFFEYADKYNLLPSHTPGETFTSFEDPRLNLQWLQDAVDTFAMQMMRFGLKTRPGDTMPKTDPPPAKPAAKPRRAPGAAPRRAETPSTAKK